MSGIPTPSPPSETSFAIGSRVKIPEKECEGVVAFFGVTSFSPGKWVGVILDEKKGKNNGSVQGKNYFECEDGYGMFIRPGQIRLVNGGMGDSSGSDASSQSSSKIPAVSGLKAPTQLRKPGKPTETPDSKMKPPTKVGGKDTRGTSSKMSPSPSMEKLKQMSGSSEKLKKVSSSEKLKPSPSTEKLKKVSSSEKLKPSPSTEKLRGAEGGAQETPRQKPPSRLAQPQTQKKEPTPKTPAGKAVAEKVAQLKEDMGRRESNEGIVRAVPESMSEGAELEYLRVEVKDLSEKLETLRIKRQEDKQKLVDYERCRIQLQGLIEYKNKMTEVHADMQKQLQQSKKEAKEAIEARETHQEDMSGLQEGMEMATLDKEMAEEKAEMLQAELDTLKERCQELEMDLEIMKNEIQDVEVQEGASVGVKMKQLEQQNERLKEALVKMRDLYGQTTSDNQRLTKENEGFRAQLADTNKKNDKYTQEAQQYEVQIGELKEQVDAALGSEDMVEQLTSKNLNLEERVRELEDTVEDLEQMRQMDEEMQESARDVERDLRQELDISAGRLNELRIQLQQSAQQMTDYDNTIKKFRQRTAELQEHIQDLKDQLLSAEAKGKRGEDSGEEEETQSLGLTGGRTSAKSFAEAVENEIRKIELENATQHVKFLKSFLPDNFGKAGGDNDAVMLNLLFPRLWSKCESLYKTLVARYPQVPGGMKRDHVVKSHKGEQWAFVAKFGFYLNNLATILHRFESVLSRCSVERLARLAQLYPEMGAQERLFDNYSELLKTNRLDENTSFDNLQRVINYFQNLYTVHLSSEDYDGRGVMRDNVKQLLAGTQWLRADMERMKFYMLPGHEASSLYKLMTELELFVGEGEQFCVRIKNRMPKDSKLTLKLHSEALDKLSEASVNLEKAANVLHMTCSAASTQVSMLPDVEGLESNRLGELLHEASIKIFGKNNDKSDDESLKLCLGILMANANRLADSMDKGEWEAPQTETQTFPPVLERAHARKQDAVEADGLRWQIDKKDKEVMELKKSLRLKAEEISECRVRMDMAEKKAATSGKEGDERVVRLQRKVEDLQHEIKKKERESEQTMDALQQEIDTLEKEITDLKDRNQGLSKRVLLQGITRSEAGGLGALSTPTGPPPAWPGQVQDSPLLLQQMENLRSALGASQEARWRAEGEQMARAVAALKPLNVPRKPTGLKSVTGLTDLDQSTHMKHDELNQLLRESQRLQKEFVDHIAHARIIDLSGRKAGEVPCVDSLVPSYQVVKQLEKRKQLSHWMKDLNTRMQRYQASQIPGAKAPSDFASFATTQFSKSGVEPVLAGRVKLGGKTSGEGKTVRVILTQDQFRKLHQAAMTS